MDALGEEIKIIIFSDDEEYSNKVSFECFCKDEFATNEDLKAHLNSHEHDYSKFDDLDESCGSLETNNDSELGALPSDALFDHATYTQSEGGEKRKDQLHSSEEYDELYKSVQKVLIEVEKETKLQKSTQKLSDENKKPEGDTLLERDEEPSRRYECCVCRNLGSSSICSTCMKFCSDIEQLPLADLNKTRCDTCKVWLSSSEDLRSHKNFVHFGKSFPCDICNEEFSDLQYLQQHKSKIHDSNYKGKVYTCSFCSKQILSKRNYHEHVFNHFNPREESDKPFMCDTCGRAYATETSLKQHQRFCNLEKKYECKRCSLKFRLKYQLYIHLGAYAKKEIFICIVCQDEFKSDPALFKHCDETGHEKPKASQRNPRQKAQCDICNAWFSNKMGLQCHKNVAHYNEGYVCEHCGKKFGLQSQYRFHLKKHSPNYVPKTHACSICMKVFFTKKPYELHMRAHEGKEQSFLCDECGMAFKSRTGIDYHKEKYHTEGQSVACNVCGKIFPGNRILRVHYQTHLKEKQDKPFSCKLCEAKCRSKKSLRQHKSRYHLEAQVRGEDYPEVCEICQNRFSNKRNLNLHIKRRHVEDYMKNRVVKTEEDYPEVCTYCEHRFSTKKHLKNHLRKTLCANSAAQDYQNSLVKFIEKANCQKPELSTDSEEEAEIA